MTSSWDGYYTEYQEADSTWVKYAGHFHYNHIEAAKTAYDSLNPSVKSGIRAKRFVHTVQQNIKGPGILNLLEVLDYEEFPEPTPEKPVILLPNSKEYRIAVACDLLTGGLAQLKKELGLG
jgi:hypothetical protein